MLAVETLTWTVWFVCVALVLLRSWRTLASARGLSLVGMFAVALELRLRAPAGPHDVNPRSVEVFLPWYALQWFYTHGQVALMRVVWAVGIPVDDLTVFNVNAWMGAAAVPLVYLVARQLGGGRVAGLSAAAALGAIGLHVRFSHTDAPQILETTLVLVAVCAALASPERKALDTALVALSLALAATPRPESVTVAVAVFVWTAAIGVRWRWSHVAWVVGLILVVGVPDLAGILMFSPKPLQRGWGGFDAVAQYGASHFVAWNTAFVPTILGGLTLLAPIGRPRSRVTFATLLLMVALGVLISSSSWSVGGTPSWCLARHQVRLLPWMALAVGFGAEGLVDAVLRRANEGRPAPLPRWVAGAMGGAMVLLVARTTSFTLEDAYAHFTPEREYMFVRAHLNEVPDHCTIVSLYLSGDAALAVPKELSLSLHLDRRWEVTEQLPSPTATQDGECRVYYRSSGCVAVSPLQAEQGDVTDKCATFERAWSLTPIVTDGLVNRGWLYEHYSETPVRVGFYRMNGPATP